MGASVAATYWAMMQGHDPALSLSLVSAVATVAVIGLERLLPRYAVWGRSHGDFWTDAIHGVATLLVIPGAMQALTFGGLYMASAHLQSWLGHSLWPYSWPIAGQVALALIVAEFGQYWLHRALHKCPLLWRLHAVHHSAPRLYWLNGPRAHPLEAAAVYAAGFMVLALLGCPEPVMALYAVFASVHSLVQHSNIDVRSGPLTWLGSQAELHRWHHSPVPAQSNRNYGNVLIIWDVVFGTRYLPDEAPPSAVGLGGDDEFPRTYLGQLWAPFSSAALGSQAQGRSLAATASDRDSPTDWPSSRR